MQLAWRTVKKIKVESLGDDVLLPKSGSEAEKKQTFNDRPWYFDRALLVLTKPSGIGDITGQSFK